MADKVFSVTQLTRSIRNNLLANNPKLAGVWIEGEVSGNKIYSSGHRYFTLKDQDAVLNCVLFAFHVGGCDENYRSLLAQSEEKVNGVKVQLQGELDLNMSRGQYSFKVSRIRIAGLGDKMAQFQALKAKLDAEGLNKLDHPEKRRPLPFLPHRIGIVTSASGAVIHDMCDVLNRRFPNVEVRLYPAKVQGEGAAISIIEGIRFFNEELVSYDPNWRADVLIVARGGGSMEDLWVFNEEPLVQAVAASKIPIISAVGHESDTTLCDYVADQRAGTPSIAMQLALPEKDKLIAKVVDLKGRLEHALTGVVETGIQQLDFWSRRLVSAPQLALVRAEHRLNELSHRLVPALKESLAEPERRLQRCALRLEPPLISSMQQAEAKLAQQRRSLELLNPFKVLERGYSITTDAEGRVLRNAEHTQKGMRLKTRLGKGEVESVVQ